MGKDITSKTPSRGSGEPPVSNAEVQRTATKLRETLHRAFGEPGRGKR